MTEPTEQLIPQPKPPDVYRRDPKGKFLPGTRAAGRLPRVTEEKYARITFNAVSEEDWEAIVKKAVAQAKNGSAKAREWLGKFVLPKGTSTTSPLVNLNFGQPMPNQDDIDAAIENRVRQILAEQCDTIDVTPLQGETS